MSMNNNNTNNTSYNTLPKEVLKYIDYELSFFEKIANKKFLFNILSNDRFELNVCETKEDNNKSEYQAIYRTNNIYLFIKNLFMLRDHLIKNFDNKITTTTS
jgi:hypothetical protein